MGIERAHELAFQRERHVPDKAHQHLAGVVVLEQKLPEGLGEGFGKLRLLELPDDGIAAVGDEHVAEGFRLLQQTALQERHLVMEGFHGFGLLQGFEL